MAASLLVTLAHTKALVDVASHRNGETLWFKESAVPIRFGRTDPYLPRLAEGHVGEGGGLILCLSPPVSLSLSVCLHLPLSLSLSIMCCIASDVVIGTLRAREIRGSIFGNFSRLGRPLQPPRRGEAHPGASRAHPGSPRRVGAEGGEGESWSGVLWSFLKRRGPGEPGLLLKGPGVLLKDPGVLLKAV